MRDIIFLAAGPLFYVIFCHFFAYFLPFVYSNFTKKKISLLQKTGVGGGGWGGGGGGGGGGRATALYLTQCRAIQWKIYFNAAECFFSMRQVQPYEQLRQHIIIYDQMLNYWRFPGISSLGFLLRDLFPERKYKGNDVLSVKRNIEK